MSFVKGPAGVGTLVVLLGYPDYYPRRFRPAAVDGVEPENCEWIPFFQARTSSCYRPELRGRFRYAQPYNDL